MTNKILWLVWALLGCMHVLQADNIKISDLKVNLPDAPNLPLQVHCSLYWENAWKNRVNHDAIWLFLKFKPADPSYNSRHVRVLPNGNQFKTTSIACGASDLKVSPDSMGIFISLADDYQGTVAWMLNLQYDVSRLSNFDLKKGEWLLYGLEMVYVPESPFFLGDPGKGGLEAAAFFQSGENGAPAGPYKLERENTDIEVGRRKGALSYRNQEPEYQGDCQGPVPAAFPKGVADFYCMKYEITQGQYAAFLNALGEQGSYFRVNFAGKDYYDSRGSIIFEDQRYKAKRPERPLNFVSWDDGCAFADWAGLRPMTELEFEKACRGPEQPFDRQFPWGSANKDKLLRFVDLDNELKYRHLQNNPPFSMESRPVTGASFYGIMDMAGSLWERVVSIGHPLGRAYTGTHGDGRLSSYGFATNADWPRGDDERGGGFGYRGGGYYEHDMKEGDFNPHSPIGWRNFAAWAGGPRSIAYGFRCVRSAAIRQTPLHAKPEESIKTAAAAFSRSLVDGDFDAVANAYTEDAKIFPPGLDILSGKTAILNYWKPSGDNKNQIVYHKITPVEVKINGSNATDWGYYEGKVRRENGETSDFKGKYLIIWQETAPGIWKMALDCWNRH